MTSWLWWVTVWRMATSLSFQEVQEVRERCEEALRFVSSGGDGAGYRATAVYAAVDAWACFVAVGSPLSDAEWLAAWARVAVVVVRCGAGFGCLADLAADLVAVAVVRPVMRVHSVALTAFVDRREGAGVDLALLALRAEVAGVPGGV